MGESDWIPVAKLGRPHGVRGEMRAWPFDEGSEILMDVDEIRIEAGDRRFKVRGCRVSNHALLLALDGINGRDEAQRLTGCIISVPVSSLPELEEDEFYHHALIGFEVLGEGERLGVLEEIHDTGGHDTLVVRDREAGVEVMIPFVDGMVEVDMEARRLIVTPPEGLIEATRAPIGAQG